MRETVEEVSSLSDSDFMSTFLDRHHPPPEAIEHFKGTWLNSYLSNPTYKVIATFSRHLKTTGEDYFFSRTINTPSTIPHMVSLQLADFKTLEQTNGASERATSPSSYKTVTQVPENPDAVMLVSLGRQGLDGHPSTIHGGVTCALMDETMGLLIMLHDNNIRGPGPRDSLYTANLNVSYRAPVPTPSELLVKTWLVSRTGRKWRSKGQLVDKDGKVLAEADGLWVVARRDKM